jgi:hypothetical protein
MVMPLPRVLSHALENADAKTQRTFDLFEELVVRLEPALRRELRFCATVPLEFPQIVASHLLCSLQRTRLTSWGVISALNAPNEVLFVMSVRAILESAANIAYLNANLLRTYAGEVSRRDMTYLSMRMKFATRKPDDLELSAEETSLFSSVNVLTTIKALDRYAATNLGFANEKGTTNWYERLCEFSHPNSFGNSVGSELNFSGGWETFELEPAVRPAVLEEFGNCAYVSLYAFSLLYNDCWRMLSDAGEALPTWEPKGHPAILLA